MRPQRTLAADTQCPARDSCPLTARREFLRASAITIAAVVASLVPRTAGALPGALPMRLTSALPRSDGEDNVHMYPIPAADGIEVDHDAQVILVRWENAVYAFNLSCPHQNTALRWDDADHRFQCPKHHSQYTPGGEFIEGRATRGLDRFSIKRAGKNVIIDLDAMLKQDVDPAGWSAAVVKLT